MPLTCRSAPCSRGSARRHRIDRALERVRCPVLVVCGRHDRIAPRDWTAALAAAVAPRGRATTLLAGAHMVPITHPDELAAEVGPFVVDPGRSLPGTRSLSP